MNKLKTNSKSSKPHLSLIYGIYGLFLLAFVLLFTACDDSSSKKDAKDNKSSNNNIITFDFTDADNTDLFTDVSTSITGTTITANVFINTEVTALIPTITINDGASIDPASGIAQDFSDPIDYTVTAKNGVAKVYTVTVSENEAPTLNQWDKIATSSEALSRFNHSTVLRNNNGVKEIFTIGGSTGSSTSNDVWKSSDGGVTWTQVISTGTKFSARAGHTSVVLKNDIYVIGGSPGPIDSSLNEVWKSSDGGVTWTEVTKDITTNIFTARRNHSSTVIESTIFVIGGEDTCSSFSDVWKSSNGGLTWIDATKDTEDTDKFPGRKSHTSVILKNAIFVIGGDTSIRNSDVSNLNDIWKSSDMGETWTEVTPEGMYFSTRSSHSSVVLENTLFVIGGVTNNGGSLGDVWKSIDVGLTWTDDTKDTADANKFSARSRHTSVALNGKVYVIGGFDSSTSQPNDIWHAK